MLTMPEENFEARYTGKKEEVPGIATFYFLPKKKIPFEPGQFAFLNFEFNGKKFRKHFTISSSPKRKKIEMTVIVSESDYKQALNNLPLGQTVEISKPEGNFTLEARKSDKIAFLVGGIGITPARSILEELASKGKNKQLEIVVFYSNSEEKRIAFKEKLEEMAEKIGNVQIVHTLTDLTEEDKGKWQGEVGFIDRKMVKRYLENEQDFSFYIAGPPKFNQAMKKMLLKELAIKEEMLILESFSGY